MKDITEISKEILDKLANWYEEAILMLPNFIMAVLVVIAFAMIARLVKKGIKKLMSKTSDNKAINNLISTIAYVAVIVVGLFFALGVLDLQKTVTSLLAGVGVIGLALGFAFQNTAANFISGVLMASKYPMRVGDQVESNGHFGKVQAIGLRYTTMRSFQGQTIIIPNKQILEDSLVNYTVTDERRIDLPCGVGYGDDLELVEKTAIQAVKELSNGDRPVEVMFSEFGDSSINFTLRFWIQGLEQHDFVKAKSEAVKALKKAFDNEGINIPFPIRTLEFNPDQFKKVMNMDFQSNGQEMKESS